MRIETVESHHNKILLVQKGLDLSKQIPVFTRNIHLKNSDSLKSCVSPIIHRRLRFRKTVKMELDSFNSGDHKNQMKEIKLFENKEMRNNFGDIPTSSNFEGHLSLKNSPLNKAFRVN